MPRPKVDAWYEAMAQVQFALGEKPRRVEEYLQAEAAKQVPPRNDFPSLKTVERWYTEWRHLPPALKLRASLFEWPQAMEAGALPWEASEAALDLLAWRDAQGIGRPTVRLAGWYWRVKQARPALPIEEAHQLAGSLSAWDFARATGRGAIRLPEGLDLYLASWEHGRRDMLVTSGAGSEAVAELLRARIGDGGLQVIMETLHTLISEGGTDDDQ